MTSKSDMPLKIYTYWLKQEPEGLPIVNVKADSSMEITVLYFHEYIEYEINSTFFGRLHRLVSWREKWGGGEIVVIDSRSETKKSIMLIDSIKRNEKGIET